MSAAQDELREILRDKERRTQHPDDDAEARSFWNDSDDETDRRGTRVQSKVVKSEPRLSMSNSRNTIPSRRYGANTGPKGVISDAQNFRDSRREQRMSMRNSYQPQPVTEHEPVPVPMEELEEDDDLDCDGDDAFMQRWRKRRFIELRKRPHDSNVQINGNGRAHFGGLIAVDGDGYLNAVDNSGPHTVVIVYIYDEYSHVSHLFEECVRTLASKHINTKFVKLHYDDAEMEPAGVPAIIAYRGGEKFAALVPVINELPDDADLSSLTLETVLKRHSILL